MVPVDNLAQVETAHTGIHDTIESLTCQLNSIVDDFGISAQKERELLERTIDDAMNHFIKLKTRLNTLAHINRLPEEIFCQIILFTGRTMAETLSHYLKYTWVCHHWRSILVQDSRFWTLVRHEHRSKRSKGQCLEDEFDNELNRRSKSAKLDVRLRGCQDFAAKFLVLKSERIRTLCIDDHSLTHLNIHNVSFSSLRSFTLSEMHSPTDPVTGLFPVLAACENPEFLQYAIMDDMRIDHVLSVFKRLKGLTLYVRSESWLLALCFLDNSPKLRILNLVTHSEDWIPDDDTLNSLRANNVTTLPELRVLESDYILAMECIRAPRISYFDVPAPISFSNTLGYPLIETFDFLSIRYLYVNDYSEHEMCLSGSAEPPECPTGKKFQDPFDDFFDCSRQGFHIRLTISPGDQLQPMLSIVIPPSTNLIHLHLLVHFKLYDLEKVLVAAPSIQTLVIDQGGELPNFIQLLHNSSILTQLEKLTYCPFAMLPETEYVYANITGKTLMACLESRKKDSVHKLRFIELFNFPALHPSWLKALNELGVEVVTDHRQRIHIE